MISKNSPTLGDGGRGDAASLIQSIATNGVYYQFSDNLNCVPNLLIYLIFCFIEYEYEQHQMRQKSS